MHRLLLPLLLLIGSPAGAAPERQDGAVLQQLARQYLEQHTQGLPGTLTITIGNVDGRALPACAAPQAFQAPGARAWGKTTVGVRCASPNGWTVYIQAQVAVVTDFVAAAVPLAAGQPIEQHQLIKLQGDIAAMPSGVVTDLQQAIGRSPTISLASGAPLRLDTLKARPVVQQGQLVRVVSGSGGFKVSNEARAIGNASDGQVVQVRTAAGAVLSGVARAGGLVEVVF